MSVRIRSPCPRLDASNRGAGAGGDEAQLTDACQGVEYPDHFGQRGWAAMATLYVASSKELAKWGSNHDLTKYLYKVGVTDEDPAATIERLNTEQHAGQSDWRLAKKVADVDAEETTILARIAAKEKLTTIPGFGMSKAGCWCSRPSRARTRTWSR
jgi:hypothetical protein